MSDDAQCSRGVCGHWIDGISIFYLAFPLILFLFGWVRWYIAFPLIGLLIYGLGNYFWRSRSQKVLEWRELFTWKNFTVLTGILTVLFFAGLSGDWAQHSDWLVRNDIFHDLVVQPWPLVCPDGVYPVYYFASWLPAACMGKIGGWEMAEKAFYCWSALGMVLTFYYIVKNVGFYSIWILVCWLLWNGAEVVPGFLYGLAEQGKWIAYSSDRMMAPYCDLGTSEIIRSFPYAYIPAVLALAMSLLPSFRMPLLFFFAAVIVLYNPMGAIFYLLVMLAFFLPENGSWHELTRHLKQSVCKTGTWANVSAALITLCCLFPFYASMGKTGFWHDVDFLSGIWVKWIFFITFDVLICALLCFHVSKRDPVFYVTVGVHAVLILLGAFYSFDLCIKACSLTHFVLLLFFLKSYFAAPAYTEWHPFRIGKKWFVAYVVVGVVPAIFSMYGCIISVFLIILMHVIFKKRLRAVSLGTAFLLLGCFVYVSFSADSRLVSFKHCIRKIWDGKKPCINAVPGIYQEDGGSGLWWWYRLFPNAHSLPGILYHKAGESGMSGAR